MGARVVSKIPSRSPRAEGEARSPRAKGWYFWYHPSAHMVLSLSYSQLYSKLCIKHIYINWYWKQVLIFEFIHIPKNSSNHLAAKQYFVSKVEKFRQNDGKFRIWCQYFPEGEFWYPISISYFDTVFDI